MPAIPIVKNQRTTYHWPPTPTVSQHLHPRIQPQIVQSTVFTTKKKNVCKWINKEFKPVFLRGQLYSERQKLEATLCNPNT